MALIAVVVESDRLLRRVGCAAFLMLGVRCYEADDPIGAAHLLRRLSFSVDVVVSACSLPRVTGLEFLVHFKSVDNISGIPFLVSVGCAEEAHLMRAVQEGADALLMRPIGLLPLRCALCSLKALPLETDASPSLLSLLPSETASALMNGASVRRIPEGSSLFISGSPPSQLALLMEGRMKEGERIYSTGDAVALEAFLSSEKLDEDVVAMQDCRVALFSRSDVEALAVESPTFCRALAEAITPPSTPPFQAPLVPLLARLHARCATGVVNCGRGTVKIHGGIISVIFHPNADDPQEALARMADEGSASFRPQQVPPEKTVDMSVCALLRRIAQL
ncbi:MAG: hypothetical protein DRP63_02580 [Planctomycetota bacterium]|nr:MAG: hypothetical protein DRP63_02580 [Planctomycetota bacterium]